MLNRTWLLVVLLVVFSSSLTTRTNAQTITADIVQADRLRSNDTGNNGQFWERTEDSQNTMRYLYGPLTNGKVDINNQINTRFRITGRGTAIWTGNPALGADPALVTGAGQRMFWYPFKKAFRVGQVDADQWNETNIGDTSIAMGFNTVASGSGSTAIGNYVSAIGQNSMIIGNGALFVGQDFPGGPINTQRVTFTNPIPNSLMVAFDAINSNSPTLFVSPGSVVNEGDNLRTIPAGVGINTVNTQGYHLFVNGKAAATQFVLLSDMRLKTNIRTIDNALEKILHLNGISYRWKEDTNLHLPEGTQLGFSAQEVEKILPELVSTGANGYKAVSYQNITAVLVEALKQQQSMIEQQKSRITQIETQLNTIMERLGR